MTGTAVKVKKEDYHVIMDEPGFERLLRILEQASVIALDLETEGFDYNVHQIVGWAFSTRAEQGFYVPVRHDPEKYVNLDPDMVVERLRPILENPEKRFCAHNAKFDTRFLARVGIADVTNVERWWATDLMAFVGGPKIEPHGLERFGLKELEQVLWHTRPVTYDSLFPARTKKEDRLIASIDPETAGWYAAADADYCLRLYHRYHDVVFNDTIFKLESMLWPEVQRIEETGVKADGEYMRRSAAYLLDQAAVVEALVLDQVALAVGERVEFSISSTKQLREVLYTRMGLPALVKTKTGEASTDEMALSELEKRGFTVARNILTYRSMRSTASQFTSLAAKISAHGRLHTQYIQYGATSGRFASREPNLQNVGKVKRWTVTRPDGGTYEVTVNPREALVASEGYWLGEFDFSAIEFAIFMHLASESRVVTAYERGDDVHRQAWSDMYRVPLESVTDEQREKAKTYNYLILYQGGGQGLSMRSDLTREEAEQAISRFYEVRPNALRWVQQVKDKARKSHKVKTVFGREQFVPEFFEPGRGAFEKALRAAVNRIVQGSAADVQKLAIIRCIRKMRTQFGFERARMVLQTHDSQTWEVHESISPDEFVPLLIAEMARKLPGLPQLRVDAKLGVSWGNLVKYKPEMDWEAIFAKQRAERTDLKLALPEPSAESELRPFNLSLFPDVEDPRKVAIPGRVVLHLNEGNVSMERASVIPQTLRAFPGENLVVLATEDEEIVLRNATTNLTAKEIEATFKPLFPMCTVSVDWGVLASAVVDARSAAAVGA